MTIPALIYIDRWGRRPMLLFGAVIMGIWLYLVGGLQARFGHAAVDVAASDTTTWVVDGNKSATYAIIGEPLDRFGGTLVAETADNALSRSGPPYPPVCSYLFVCSYAVTWGPCSWTYAAESEAISSLASRFGRTLEY